MVAKGEKGDPGTNGTNGTNGAPGVSPTVKQLTAGDRNCPAGGAAITDASGSTAYVCSGADGKSGADGQPFSGTFTSPNGQYSISVTDTGITIKRDAGPLITLLGDAITVRGGTVSVQANTNAEVRAGLNATVLAGGSATVKGSQDTTITAGATVTLEAGGNTNISGGLVKINGGVTCHPAARVSDTAVGAAPNGGGAVVSTILTGSFSVCIG